MSVLVLQQLFLRNWLTEVPHSTSIRPVETQTTTSVLSYVNYCLVGIRTVHDPWLKLYLKHCSTWNISLQTNSDLLSLSTALIIGCMANLHAFFANIHVSVPLTSNFTCLWSLSCCSVCWFRSFISPNFFIFSDIDKSVSGTTKQYILPPSKYWFYVHQTPVSCILSLSTNLQFTLMSIHIAAINQKSHSTKCIFVTY